VVKSAGLICKQLRRRPGVREIWVEIGITGLDPVMEFLIGPFHVLQRFPLSPGSPFVVD